MSVKTSWVFITAWILSGWVRGTPPSFSKQIVQPSTIESWQVRNTCHGIWHCCYMCQQGMCLPSSFELGDMLAVPSVFWRKMNPSFKKVTLQTRLPLAAAACGCRLQLPRPAGSNILGTEPEAKDLVAAGWLFGCIHKLASWLIYMVADRFQWFSR